MPIHDADQECRLRLVKPNDAFTGGHKLGRLISIPCALRFVEDCNPFNRRVVCHEIGVSEVMDILNEAFDLALGL